MICDWQIIRACFDGLAAFELFAGGGAVVLEVMPAIDPPGDIDM